MPSASIKFTQNAVPGTAGRAYIGAASTPVTVENGGSDSGVTSWKIVLLYAPSNSGLVSGTVLATGGVTHPTAAFTPDVPGTYQVQLALNGATANPSIFPVDQTAGGRIDTRDFLCPNRRAWKVPAKGSTDATFNYGGQPNGWAPSQEEIANYLDATLRVQITDYGADASGAADATTHIQAALTAASDVKYPTGTFRIAASTTIGTAGKTHRFERGAVLKPDAGQTLAIAGAIDAAGDQQIFDLSLGGSVVFTTPQAVVYPGWFGAQSDNSIDCTAAFAGAVHAALAAGNGATIVVPPGDYKCGNVNIANANNLLVEGGGAVMHWFGTAAGDYLGFELSGTCSHVEFRGFRCIGDTVLANKHAGVWADSAANLTDIVVDGFHVTNTVNGLRFVSNGKIDHVEVRGCYLENILGSGNQQGYGVAFASADGSDFKAINTTVKNAQRHGFYMAQGSGVLINGCTVREHRQGLTPNSFPLSGIVLARVRSFKVVGCHLLHCEDAAVSIEPDETTPAAQTGPGSITACTFEDNLNYDIYVGTSDSTAPFMIDGLTVTSIGIRRSADVIVVAGTNPPAVQFTGIPSASTTPVRVEITTGGARGAALFRYSLDGGATWTSGVTTAATVALGASGVTANFPGGTSVTYSTDNVWYVTRYTGEASRTGKSIVVLAGRDVLFEKVQLQAEAAYDHEHSLIGLYAFGGQSRAHQITFRGLRGHIGNDGAHTNHLIDFAASACTSDGSWISIDDNRFMDAIGPVTKTGTAPPTVNLTGIPTAPVTSIRIVITTGGASVDAVVFKWSIDGGSTYTTGVSASGGRVALGTSGITAIFNAGTYTNDNVYVATPYTPLSAPYVYDTTVTNRTLVIDGVGTYIAGDTTPSVANGVKYMNIANSGAVTITDFLGSVPGQEISLTFSDANTTINQHDAVLSGAVSFVSAQYKTLKLLKATSLGTYWHELSRSSNG